MTSIRSDIVEQASIQDADGGVRPSASVNELLLISRVGGIGVEAKPIYVVDVVLSDVNGLQSTI